MSLLKKISIINNIDDFKKSFNCRNLIEQNLKSKNEVALMVLS